MKFKIPEFLKKKIFYYIMGTPVVLYLLLSVIPNLIGCRVPENYCLTGSDQLVDVLTISAYVIPIILVIGAYNAWRMQKGAEVVAHEAKSYLIKLSELQSLQGDIFKSIIESNGLDINKTAVKDFKEIQDQLANSVVFLGFAINSEQFSHDSSTFYAQTINFLKDVQGYLDGKKNVNEIKGINPVHAYKLSEDLLEYALFEKELVKRKKTYSEN
ncbi:hypothetical protein ACW7EJ_00800 [Acinetobacter soli]